MPKAHGIGPERLRDLLRLAGVDETAVSVVRGDALEDEVPSLWIAVQQQGTLPSAVPLLPLGGISPGATNSMQADGDPHAAHDGVATISQDMQC